MSVNEAADLLPALLSLLLPLTCLEINPLKKAMNISSVWTWAQSTLWNIHIASLYNLDELKT